MESLLLTILRTSSNEERRQSEEHFEQQMADPDAFCRSLLTCMTSSADPGVRQLAAVMLRRKLVARSTKREENLFFHLSPDTAQGVQAELIAAVEHEEQRVVALSIGEAISQTAVFILEGEGQWPGLLGVLHQMANSMTPLHREIALNVFRAIAQSKAGLSLQSHFDVLNTVFTQTLQDPVGVVRVAALRATVSFVLTLSGELRERFSGILSPAIDVLRTFLVNSEEELAQLAVSVLIDLTDDDPLFLRPVLVELVALLLDVGAADQLLDDTRTQALELIVTMVENLSPLFRQRLPDFPTRVLNVAVSLMSGFELDDQEETMRWAVWDG